MVVDEKKGSGHKTHPFRYIAHHDAELRNVLRRDLVG